MDHPSASGDKQNQNTGKHTHTHTDGTGEAKLGHVSCARAQKTSFTLNHSYFSTQRAFLCAQWVSGAAVRLLEAMLLLLPHEIIILGLLHSYFLFLTYKLIWMCVRVWFFALFSILLSRSECTLLWSARSQQMHSLSWLEVVSSYCFAVTRSNIINSCNSMATLFIGGTQVQVSGSYSHMYKPDDAKPIAQHESRMMYTRILSSSNCCSSSTLIYI